MGDPSLNIVTLAWCPNLVDPRAVSIKLCRFLFKDGHYAGEEWLCDPSQLATDAFSAEVLSRVSFSIGCIMTDYKDQWHTSDLDALVNGLGNHGSLYIHSVEGYLRA